MPVGCKWVFKKKCRRNQMVGHETQTFILVWGVVHANPYSSGVAALVFVCSNTGVVAPSCE
jgi:hypothetical protein